MSTELDKKKKIGWGIANEWRQSCKKNKERSGRGKTENGKHDHEMKEFKTCEGYRVAYTRPKYSFVDW